MQLCAAAADTVGVTDPFDPEQSIMGGAAYYRRKLDRHGDHRLALAAYNAGSNNVPGGLDYARVVLRLYQAYQSGVDVAAPRRSAPRFASADQEVPERSDAPVSDAASNADTCAGFSDPIREIMRSRGRCP